MEVSFHLKKKIIKEKRNIWTWLVAVKWRCTFVPSFRKDDPLHYLFEKDYQICECRYHHLLRHVVEGRYYCITFCFSDSWYLAGIHFSQKIIITCLEMSNFVYACVSACFSVHVRGSEYIPLLGSSADPYSFFGASDFDQWRLEARVPNWVLNEQLPKRIVMSRLVLGSILFIVLFYCRFMLHALESANLGSTW
jgi:hypothetical protein